MDLKKINKNNLDVMFYKHAEKVVSKYNNYVHQKEQLMFLDVVHELAVEHALKIIKAITEHDYNSDEFYNLDDVDNGKANKLRIGDFDILSYKKRSDNISIHLREHGGTDRVTTIMSTHIAIFNVEDRYKLYAYHSHNVKLSVYEFGIKETSAMTVRSKLVNKDVSTPYVLIIDNSDDIAYNKFSDVFNMENIKKETDEFKYIKNNFPDILTDREKLKDFLMKYVWFNIYDDYFDSLNHNKHMDVSFNKISEHSSAMVYSLLFDAKNMLSMMYDDMINNVDKYISYFEDSNLIYKEHLSDDNMHYMISNTLDNHFQMLFRYMNIDVNTLVEYSETKDVRPIIKKMLINLKASDESIGRVSFKLSGFVGNDKSDKGFNSRGVFNHGLNIILNGPDEKIMFRADALDSILTNLIDGKDNMLNLLTVIMLLDYDKYKGMQSVNITDGNKRRKEFINMPYVKIFDDFLNSKIGNSSLSYNRNKWDKSTVESISHIIKA